MAKVYSTEHGRLCPGCGEPVTDCRCAGAAPPTGDGIVRVQRQTKGRGGKAVTLVTGLGLPRQELSALAKALKQRLGTGGAVKGFDVEIQGDRRNDVKTELERHGYTVRISGG